MPSNPIGAYILTPCRMDALAMGGLVAIAVRERPEWLRNRWIGWARTGAAAVFASVWVLAGNIPWSRAMRTIGFTSTGLAFASLLAALVGRRPRPLLVLLRARILVWLGTISYGLYLLHVAAPAIAHGLLDPLIKLRPRGSADLFLLARSLDRRRVAFLVVFRTADLEVEGAVHGGRARRYTGSCPVRWNQGPRKVASSEVVRDINRRIVLNLIRTRQPISRADLARVSGLQRSTISLIVEQLHPGALGSGGSDRPAAAGPASHLPPAEQGTRHYRRRPAAD